MGFLSRLFGPRSTPAGANPPDRAPEPGVDARLLLLIRQQLLSSGVPGAAGVAIEGRQLVTQDRRLAVVVQVREVTKEKVHAHVISLLPNPDAPGGADELDACVMGIGSPEAATAQAAEVWLRLVGAPILSCLSGQVVLDADHFSGDEEWGVPGGHGFAGPFMVRGEPGIVDLDELARIEAFQFDGYPRDGRRHLAKVTLLGRPGRWTRHLEIDGHADSHVDENWQCAIPGPRASVVCVRFAVFDFAGAGEARS